MIACAPGCGEEEPEDRNCGMQTSSMGTLPMASFASGDVRRAGATPRTYRTGDKGEGY
jgi:hypothetical protein